MLGRHNFFDLQGLYRTRESLDRILAKKDIKYDESKQNKNHIYANILADLGLSEMIYEFKKLNVAVDREAIQAQNIEKNFFDLKLSTLIQKEITKDLIKKVVDTFVKSKKLEEMSAEVRDLLAKKSEEARSRAYANALREQENQLFQKIALQLAGMNNQTLNQLSNLLGELKSLEKELDAIRKQRAQILDFHSTKMANAFSQYLPNAKPEELKKLSNHLIEDNVELLNDINQHVKSKDEKSAQIANLKKVLNAKRNALEEVIEQPHTGENPKITEQQQQVENLEVESQNIENRLENLELAKEAEDEAFQKELAELEKEDNDNEDDWDVDTNEDPEKAKKSSAKKSPENFAAKLLLIEEHKHKINAIDHESEKLKSKLQELKQDRLKIKETLAELKKESKLLTDEQVDREEGTAVHFTREAAKLELEGIEDQIAALEAQCDAHEAKANAGKAQFGAIAAATAAEMGHRPKDPIAFGQCALQHALPAAAALSASAALEKDNLEQQAKVKQTAAQVYEQNAQFSASCTQGLHDLKSASFQGRNAGAGAAAMAQIQVIHQQIQSTGSAPHALRING